MKNLKKFSNFESLFESFNLDNEDIENLFIDYVDNKQFGLVEGFVSSNNRFFTDVANVKKDTKKCKEVTITLDEVSNGIESRGGTCFTDIKTLSDILRIIEQFYLRSGESPNFLIKPTWGGDLEIKFYIVGGLVESTELETKDKIESFLKELEIILKTKYNYKKVNLKGSNWLEIRTPVKGGGMYGNDYALNQKIKRSFNNQLDATRDADIIQWATKVTDNGFRCELSGGDNQVVVKLLKT
jgi:hypothetical protein